MKTHLDLGGRAIEVQHLASAHPHPGAPPLVFLHEGLGSISMWRDFPQRLADATGCAAILYSRHGYGRSTPLAAPRNVRYMHEEALETLPALLDALDVEKPFLFGHSDGGSISLIHAGGAGRDLTGVIVMAPHVFVEEVALVNIRVADEAYRMGDLRSRLARHHGDVDSAFRGWNDIWLHPEFRDWNIEGYLPTIPCPVLAIQGEDDEYGTMEQLERIARGARDVELVKLADCRHSPHKDQPEAVIAAVTGFVADLLAR
ncbi:alpha/beta fold hydrolase [Zoogloea sp.]|uniref:alpha/beta fold hydrolase n=1 Tax=Zoogloea sp. TaxID=49181 RepID=UPI0035AF31CA